jgi:hypothetical protein
LTTLTQLFVDYLRERSELSTASALQRELESAGYDLEAWCMKRYRADPDGIATVGVDGPWHGCRATFGVEPPEGAAPGDLWFDPLEVVPMVLLRSGDATDQGESAGTAPRSWLAIRPVALWQFSGFLELAPVSPRRRQVKSPLNLLDRARLLSGPETARVTNVTLTEAAMYANWFGKSIGGRGDWQAAYAQLSARQLYGLWGPSQEELGGELDEGIGIVIRPETVNLDYESAYDAGSHSDLFISEFDHRREAAFRTRILVQLGLIRTAGDYAGSFADLGLDAVLPRR